MANKSEVVGLVTRDQLLGLTGRRFHEFSVSGLPSPVRIRSLTEREKAKYEMELLGKKGGGNPAAVRASRRKLIVLTAVDREGNPILSEEDVHTLEDIDGGITSQIFAEAQKHCGFSLPEVEEATKN